MIECKICGKSFKRVCRHAQQAHGVSAREYKEEFGYDVKKGIMTEHDREIMRQHALDNKMDEKLKIAGAKSRFKKGQKGIGKYKRSRQTLERLKENRKKHWKGKQKERFMLICKVCGDPFEVTKSKLEKSKFCSIPCSNKGRDKIKKYIYQYTKYLINKDKSWEETEDVVVKIIGKGKQGRIIAKSITDDRRFETYKSKLKEIK